MTTLLNHILTSEHGKRIAVIENEYGEVDIDGSLIASQMTGAEDIVMLNNDCENKDSYRNNRSCKSCPVIQTFYAEENIADHIKLDGVVTLVDVKNAKRHLEEIKPKGVVNRSTNCIC